MSYLESPVETVIKFIPSWRDSHPKRLSEEIISVFNETNRNPDSFKLVYQNGRILNYETREPVKINRSSYVGQKEGEFFDAFTEWLKFNNEGTAVWISPLLSGVYPSNKITLYEIIRAEGEEKITLNTSLILDTPLAHCLEIASKLHPSFSSHTNPEVLRNKLFSLDKNFGVLNLLGLTSAGVNSKASPGQEIISQFMDLIYSGFDSRFIAERMSQKGVIGEHAVSCASLNQPPGPTFGTFMDSRSFLMKFTGGGESGKYVKNCGGCGVRIESRISKGYKCSNCGGVYEGC